MTRTTRTALAVWVAAATLAGCGPSPTERARDPLLIALKDPGSAQFRNERLKGEILCGEVNAKNSLGGYTGFARFITRPGSVALEGSPIIEWDRSKDQAGLAEAHAQAAAKAWKTVETGMPDPAVVRELQQEAEFAFLWRWYCDRA